MVTTTSLDNSGFLDYIVPYFEEEYDVDVKIIALGTGAALEMGKLGQADILLVHSYDLEVEFINDGYGLKRHNVMYNDFVFLGPSSFNASSIEEALGTIIDNYSFYSRGDNSGTHIKELSLWSEYGYDVSSFADWYKETGQAMGSTLTMASFSGYYTLSDRTTFLAMKDNLDLVIAYENREELINQYGIIEVNPNLHNRGTINADLFYHWIISNETKELISGYILDGEQGFYPNS